MWFLSQKRHALFGVECAGGARSGARRRGLQAAPEEVREPPEHAGGRRRPHASGPSSCGRPPVQSVGRPLPHLVAYGSTNKYRPVSRSKASGGSAMRPTQTACFFSTKATMLAMTATVKAMASQRWVCRTKLFQFNGTSSEDEPEAHRAHLQVLRNRVHGALFCDPPRFTSFEPPETAGWAFQYRTAWRTPRSAAASRRTSWPRRRRFVQSAHSLGAAQGRRRRCAGIQNLDP